MFFIGNKKTTKYEVEIMVQLSIILPVFNSGQYLSRCLDSLTKISVKDLEVIVVDDGSTDDSKLIISEYQNKYPEIKYLYQINQGVSAARNTGIAAACGEYITFVDSDDWIEPDIYQEMITRMRETDSDLAVTGFVIEPSGRIPRRSDWGIPELIDGKGLDLHSFVSSMFFSVPWNKMYRRSIIGEYGLFFDERIHYAEDYIFNMHYINAITRISIRDSPMYHNSARPGSLSRTPQIDRHPSTMERTRIQSIYYHNWDLSTELTGWDYRLQILSIISRTISAYHKRNDGFRSFHTNLDRLHKTLHEYGHYIGDWITDSQRTKINKVKLRLFRFRVYRLLYLLLFLREGLSYLFLLSSLKVNNLQRLSV